MAGMPVRVLIADDQQLTAAGTAAALVLGEFEFVGVAASAAEAAELAALTQPDVALVDVRLPAAARSLSTRSCASPDTHVLAHSGVLDHDAVIAMFRAGASGYVVRDAATDKLAAALRGAARGDSIFDDVVGRALIHELLDQVRDDEPGPRGAGPQARANPLGHAERRSSTSSSSRSSTWRPREVVGHEALSRFASHPSAARRSGSRRRTRSGSAWSWSCGRYGWPASARTRCRRRPSWR